MAFTKPIPTVAQLGAAYTKVLRLRRLVAIGAAPRYLYTQALVNYTVIFNTRKAAGLQGILA